MGSPYCEKIRLLFGLKNLAWRGVDIPVVMPKPDYLPREHFPRLGYVVKAA